MALAGSGAFADLSTTQTIGGAKTFSIVPKSSQDASGGTDLVRKSQFDTALSGKAATSHTHAVADVSGLQPALDGKLDDSQATAFGLSLLDDADAATARTTLGLGTAATSSASAFAGASHAHAIGDVTGLQTVLDGKAATTHAHAIGDVTGLQVALDGKAAASHVHAIADVTGLQAAIDAKAPLASPALTGTPTAPTAVLVYAHTPSGAPITSVTVGGAATTVLGQDTGNGFFLTNAPVTSGTTATVVISCATQALRGAAYTWSVTGRPALTEYMTGTSSSLNVAANGAAFAVCILASGADDAATWTGLTERHESYFDAITNITAASDSFATAQVSRTVDVTWTTAGNDGNVRAVSLRPT